jgi:hypothetical protein
LGVFVIGSASWETNYISQDHFRAVTCVERRTPSGCFLLASLEHVGELFVLVEERIGRFHDAVNALTHIQEADTGDPY